MDDVHEALRAGATRLDLSDQRTAAGARRLGPAAARARPEGAPSKRAPNPMADRLAVLCLALAAPACRAAPPAPPTPVAPRAPATADARDLSRCPLDVRAYALEAGAGPPSAPFAAGDGVAVVYARAHGDAAERVLQRVGADGSLSAPRALGPAASAAVAPLLVAQGDTLSFPVSGAGRALLQAFDLPSGAARADAPPVLLPGLPSQLTAGPRGLFLAHAPERDTLALARGVGGPAPDVPVNIAAPPIAFDPVEQLLASGERADVALVLRAVEPEGAALDLVALAPGGALPATRFELARGRPGVESSVAAGPSGFLVAWGVADFDRLSLTRLDPAGARAAAPEALRGAAPGRVLRFPRVTPLGAGWAVSYWDGVGPAVQRLDAAGRPLGAPVEVRSGDERGGQTDARMFATGDALAISWQVSEPRMGHGLREELPRHPGPRLAIARCRAAATARP